MGKDGNTIEIEIDAAATVAAAKTAGEANAKLVKFDQALGLFRDNVGLVSKTTEDVATRMGDFNTILGKFADSLVTNLADMQTSVVQKIEPHLERELENMVNRVLNKVEAKTGTTGESRSRSEAKQGAAATPQVTTVKSPPGERPDAIRAESIVTENKRNLDKMGNIVGGALKSTSKTQTKRYEFGQDTGEDGERIDVRKEFIDEFKSVTIEKFDALKSISEALDASHDANGGGWDSDYIGRFIPGMERAAEKTIFKPMEAAMKQQADAAAAIDAERNKKLLDTLGLTNLDTEKFENLVSKPYNAALSNTGKATKAATVAERDRGIAIRKEITGALIGLHVMKVVSQYSSVANAGFMMIFTAMGHLLNNILLPMMPAFIIFAQALHTVANIIQMLPMPIRQLIGALLIWKATSMLVASMPLKDIKDGFAGIKQVMDGADTGFKKFISLVRAFIDFMNSGQGKGAVSWIGGGLGKVGGAIAGGAKKLLGKRAGGGPVLGHGAYIVGEKGPEIFVPKTSGSIIPNHKIGRAEGGDVTAAPFGGDILGNLGTGLGVGGLAYMLTGSPLLAAGLGAGAGMLGPAGIANMIGSAVSSDIGANMIASLNVMTGMISSILAPLAPIMGVVGALLGVVTGARAAGGGGGGDRTAETVAKFGNEQLKTTGKMSYGIQNATAMSGRGINKILSMILIRLGNCLYVAPCKPDSFANATTSTVTNITNTLTALPAAIAVAITSALAALAGTITYTILTNGQVPVVTPIATTITYDILTNGQAPVVTPIATTITYDIVTRGQVPTAEDVRANITYDIVKNGVEPVVTDKAATIRYDIIKNGIEPIAESKTADITYNIRAVGTLPQTSGITYDVTGRITSIDFTKLPVDLAKVDLAAKITEVKVAEPLRVEKPVIDTTGRIVEGKPSDSLKSRIPELDVRGLIGEAKPSDIIIRNPPEIEVKPKVPDGFNWRSLFGGGSGGTPEVRVEPKLTEGFSLKTLFEKASTAGLGEFLGLGAILALQEYARTGTVKLTDLLVSLGLGTLTFAGAEAVLTSVAGSLGGAVAAGAVGTAFGVVGAGISALIAGGVAKDFVDDLNQGMTDAVNAGGMTVDFGNFVLNGAAKLGEQFSQYLKENFHVEIPSEAFRLAGLALGLATDMVITPGVEWVPLFDNFIQNVKTTLAGGVPVDVKIDVDSVTSVVNAVRETAAGTPISGGASVPGEMVGECPEGQYWDRALQACAPIGNFIPSHADGGRVIPSIPNLVGEKGPELFIPDTSPTSIGGGGGSGGSVTNHFTFHVTTNNPRELTDTVMKELKMELARVKM